jgi:hypothetical protein
MSMERVLSLRNAATNGPILHPRVNVSVESHGNDDDDAGWGKLLTRYQRSLAILPGETLGASRRNGRSNENFAY